MLGTALFAEATGGAGGGTLRVDVPVQTKAGVDNPAVAITKQQMVVGIEKLGDRNPLRTGQAVATTGAEPVKTAVNMIEELGLTGIAAGGELIDGGDGFIDLRGVGKTHQCRSDGRMGEVEAQCGGGHRFLRVAF